MRNADARAGRRQRRVRIPWTASGIVGKDGDVTTDGRKLYSKAHGAWDLIADLRGDNPDAELQRHLTDALAVLLREPSLTIDAGTLAMLARHKAKAVRVRGADGRWRKA